MSQAIRRLVEQLRFVRPGLPFVANELKSSQGCGPSVGLRAAGLDDDEIAVTAALADCIARRRRTAAEAIALAESDEAAQMVAEFVRKKQEWEAYCSAAAARRRAGRRARRSGGRLIPFEPRPS
jgi:hypothetical protein